MRLTDVETYEKYADELVRFATGLVGPDQSQDVVADAFVRVFQSGSWNRVSEQRAYLYRAVLNEVRMHRRSRSRREARERRLAGRQVEDRNEAGPDLWRAMSVLSPRQRASVVLTYWEDLTPSQIAERLGVSDGAVRRHLARARAKLRELLDA